MKASSHDIETRIERAVRAVTPDVLPSVLLRVQQEGESVMTQTNSGAVPPIVLFPTEQPAPKKRTWIKWVGAVAAMLVLTVGVAFGIAFLSPQAIISLDANPSIEMKVNRYDRVLSVTPLNDDAGALIGDMDLRYVDVDVALNALIGSMVQHGYISDVKNSILVTVDGGNTQKNDQLQQRLSAVAASSLNAYHLDGAVLSQTVSDDDRLKALANDYDISLGKAALVDLLVSQDDTLVFADIAKLPINDINLLLNAKHTDLGSVSAHGQASVSAYIGADEAKAIALQHAGVTASAASLFDIELDYDDGRLVYEIEFYAGSTEYDYEIDATTGDILSFDHDMKKNTGGAGNTSGGTGGSTSGGSTNPSTAGTIGKDKAQEIALTHAGVSAGNAQILKVDLDHDDGRLVYEIEFYAGNTEYEYDIDAATGDILSFDHETKGGSGSNTSGGSSSPSTADTIGEGKAQSIALTHAGLSANDVQRLKIKLDYDDGRLVYEVEFHNGRTEYDYEIDAVTGDILKWETDYDD